MNAAVVTDSTLQLAQDLVKEVEANWRTSLSERKSDVQTVVYNLAALSSGIFAPPSMKIGLPYNKNLAVTAEGCYLPTKLLLESFANLFQAGHHPVFKTGQFGIYDPKADRGRMSLGQKFNEDKLILLPILPEFACSIRSASTCLPRMSSLGA
ncbi:hypothetical protein ASPACDRAFT_74235 [Aspergillus aculeatus ATCC 16872]|uniref:Uncharacterized protein n=1 Tax=Aspergillus aculeatus (strain ATCC 16872 / CBS 172.66 / WB 5094) TaxID=690307 RepID=A0A1L9X8G7_ASPA1|nr:uncharacterized protein ASPACDRAFT_74235 [Aspergillus aculeatus ATCC 16872]OJK04629.1 hypothetical protein ASPACDRAFT_74235 [Aspergillus aculeatus ATCC 16872]